MDDALDVTGRDDGPGIPNVARTGTVRTPSGAVQQLAETWPHPDGWTLKVGDPVLVEDLDERCRFVRHVRLVRPGRPDVEWLDVIGWDPRGFRSVHIDRVR